MICQRCAKDKDDFHTCSPSPFVLALEDQIEALCRERDEWQRLYGVAFEDSNAFREQLAAMTASSRSAVNSLRLIAELKDNQLTASKETVRYAEYILNHYSRNSHADHLVLARHLEAWAERQCELSEQLIASQAREQQLREEFSLIAKLATSEPVRQAAREALAIANEFHRLWCREKTNADIKSDQFNA